ncbi:hypothetical protein [Thermus thermophilus HB8]|uniref:Uncharacterized protein n=1 Tax=Thermus thermophilus (strain ATCC 27634 / DSM 579 / HB8) TaxID=300852 RepID=Q5SJU2_THET8|nr:hypothetical protein [Thermus thermophilus HB8]
MQLRRQDHRGAAAPRRRNPLTGLNPLQRQSMTKPLGSFTLKCRNPLTGLNPLQHLMGE